MQELSPLFPGGGACGALLRSVDWRSTPLGSPDGWPTSLKSLVRAVLHARQPMLLWWGPALVQFYNDAFRPSFGVGKHPSAMGQPARQCWEEVWPVVGAQLEEVMASGTPSWFEDVLVPINRNGRLEDAWWIYNYSPVFDDDGVRAGVLIICTETTTGVLARRQLEQASREAELAREELHGVFMQMPLPIAILSGPEHRFTLANRAYQALVNRPVLGKTLAEAFTDEEAGQYRPILDEVYRSGQPIVIREAPLQLPNADGVVEQRYIDVSYHPYRDAHLTIRGIMAVINDVTVAVAARKEIEDAGRDRALRLEREQALRAAAEAGGRARDEFLAMLGHELRNPLAPIRSALDLMQLRGTDVMARERAVIERQTNHLSALVDDLLDVSRITRGTVELRRAPCRLARLVARAVETTAPLFDQHRHQLTAEIPDDLVIDVDEARLTQVLSNLLSNAAKYTDPGGHVRVSATAEDGEVLVTVQDDGRGISSELLPRVFDLFVQERQNIDRSQGGLGLGLAIVKSLVELHGGGVGASSAGPGQGSTFWVRVPRSLAPAPDEAATERPGVRPAGGTASLLIVDDNVDAALTLSDLLRGLGYETRVAHDGPQALAIAHEFVPTVALLDIGLPVMDGYELAHRLREMPAWRSVRLVAITGYGQRSDRERSLATGFDHHLVKPIDLAALQDTITGATRS